MPASHISFHLPTGECLLADHRPETLIAERLLPLPLVVIGRSGRIVGAAATVRDELTGKGIGGGGLRGFQKYGSRLNFLEDEGQNGAEGMAARH